MIRLLSASEPQIKLALHRIAEKCKEATILIVVPLPLVWAPEDYLRAISSVKINGTDCPKATSSFSNSGYYVSNYTDGILYIMKDSLNSGDNEIVISATGYKDDLTIHYTKK